MSTDLSDQITNKMRNDLYQQWFRLTNDFNPSPSFEKVFEQFQLCFRLLKNDMSISPSSNCIDVQLTLWTESLPQDIPEPSHIHWRELILCNAIDYFLSDRKAEQITKPNTELLNATKKIVSSLNLFDQASLVISMTNKARFSGQLSQALRNDMISNDQKKELEQAFHVIKQFKHGDNYLHKATENHLAKKKKQNKEQPQPQPQPQNAENELHKNLPPTRSPSPFTLEEPISPSLKKQIKVN